MTTKQINSTQTPETTINLNLPASGDDLTPFQVYLSLCAALGKTPSKHWHKFRLDGLRRINQCLLYEWLTDGADASPYVYFLRGGKLHIGTFNGYELHDGCFMARCNAEGTPYLIPAANIRRVGVPANGVLAIRYRGELVRMTLYGDTMKVSRRAFHRLGQLNECQWARDFDRSGVTVSLPDGRFEHTMHVLILG